MVDEIQEQTMQGTAFECEMKENEEENKIDQIDQDINNTINLIDKKLEEFTLRKIDREEELEGIKKRILKILIFLGMVL